MIGPAFCTRKGKQRQAGDDRRRMGKDPSRVGPKTTFELAPSGTGLHYIIPNMASSSSPVAQKVEAY